MQKDAARLLGLKPTTLNEMIKRHSIVLPRERERRALKEIETPRAEDDVRLMRRPTCVHLERRSGRP